MMVDVYLRSGSGGSAKGWREGDDVAVQHRQRREVFVQNGEGWLNCYRSSSHANIVYLAQQTPIPDPFASSPPPRSFRRPSLSTHYANMRYQFDGDPRLFVSPILMTRPFVRSIG